MTYNELRLELIKLRKDVINSIKEHVEKHGSIHLVQPQEHTEIEFDDFIIHQTYQARMLTIAHRHTIADLEGNLFNYELLPVNILLNILKEIEKCL